jgi:hypothetical protein
MITYTIEKPQISDWTKPVNCGLDKTKIKVYVRWTEYAERCSKKMTIQITQEKNWVLVFVLFLKKGHLTRPSLEARDWALAGQLPPSGLNSMRSS